MSTNRASGVVAVSLSHVLLGGLLIVMIVALSAGCRQPTEAASEPLPAVEIEPAAEQDVPIYGEWVGTTVGYVTAQIRARVSGYLMRQNYKEGTLVKAGDVLFEIDPRTYEFAEHQARAALLLAESQLEQSRAQVAQAEADLARAEATQKRSELYVQIAISEQEYLRWSQRGATERLRDLRIVLADGTTYPHRGTAEILDRDVGRTTGTINLRGVFPNPGELLRPGQFVKVRAVVDLKKDAILVPQRAVQDLQGIHQVAVVGADETVDVMDPLQILD